VACDVHATRNWGLMRVSAGLEQIAERMATEPDAEADDAAPAEVPAAAKNSKSSTRKSGH